MFTQLPVLKLRDAHKVRVADRTAATVLLVGATDRREAVTDRMVLQEVQAAALQGAQMVDHPAAVTVPRVVRAVAMVHLVAHPLTTLPMERGKTVPRGMNEAPRSGTARPQHGSHSLKTAQNKLLRRWSSI